MPLNLHEYGNLMDSIWPYILLGVLFFQKYGRHRALESQAAISEAAISEAAISEAWDL